MTELERLQTKYRHYLAAYNITGSEGLLIDLRDIALRLIRLTKENKRSMVSVAREAGYSIVYRNPYWVSTTTGWFGTQLELAHYILEEE